MVLELAKAARELVWQAWNDAYVVYQPSSAETHVFNGTTALILESLEQGPQSIESVKDRVQEALGVAQNVLTANDFAFAVGRLEELGLVERFDEASSVQCLSVT